MTEAAVSPYQRAPPEGVVDAQGPQDPRRIVRSPGRSRRWPPCSRAALAPRDGASARVIAGTIYRSLMAARLLYQFISTEVPSDVVRYTSMMIAMHSTARPVWLIAVLEIETTSG